MLLIAETARVTPKKKIVLPNPRRLPDGATAAEMILMIQNSTYNCCEGENNSTRGCGVPLCKTYIKDLRRYYYKH